MHTPFASDQEKFWDICTQHLLAMMLLLEFVRHPTPLLGWCSSVEEGQSHLVSLNLLLKLVCTKTFALKQMKESSHQPTGSDWQLGWVISLLALFRTTKGCFFLPWTNQSLKQPKLLLKAQTYGLSLEIALCQLDRRMDSVCESFTNEVRGAGFITATKCI